MTTPIDTPAAAAPRDWVEAEFPASPYGIPSEQEWARADELAGKPLPRLRPSPIGPVPGNRAWMRSRVRRATYRRQATAPPRPLGDCGALNVRSSDRLPDPQTGTAP